MNQNAPYRGLIGTVAALALWGFATLGQAASLVTKTPGLPDIDSSGDSPHLEIHYNAGSQAFSANSGGFFFFDPAPPTYFSDGSYSVSAQIDTSGNLIADPGNLVSLYGDIDGGTGVLNLFTGHISQFAYTFDASANTSEFQFVVDVTSTDASLGFNPGTQVGIIMLSHTNWGSFGGGFDDTAGTATVDNFLLASVPEPSILALLGIGALATGLRSRRGATTA
ncbi:PEP-CTERM protein-sorting domain-containing protein [Methylomagnum ishizawai]|uniref:PEP-CTERM protein-sorting domain-containing protein n=1 Tax=Methylomagnum ishizawai TaxID=1760988 RepID=A0A1Y6DAJ3_9GAMM|nr:PEP-CTERM sorting domain-containing protein [Methylomagnum ishizawai]SMF97194.1 PEP-CTERM protein-sorting domain-containing protein [Methylomagnum ishizawai]